MADFSAVNLPQRHRSPGLAALRRIGMAALLVFFVAIVVRSGQGGFVDGNGDGISLLDSIYYASVTVTTTGYGDITAVDNGARLATIVLITPARILFLILVVSTTVEVLTEQSRVLLAKRRWRQTVKNHTVICGFGSTGQAAARDLITRGVDPDTIVVVDSDPVQITQASELGLVAVHGDASKVGILEQAGIADAESIIVSPNRDDTAVLITLTVREKNPTAHIVTGVREQENLHLLRQSGADEVIDATAAIGRMLGLGCHDPAAVRVLDDLLDAGRGIELVELAPGDRNGDDPVPLGTTLVGIVRNGERLPPGEVRRDNVRPADHIVVLRET